jgi:hypothetical protein
MTNGGRMYESLTHAELLALIELLGRNASHANRLAIQLIPYPGAYAHWAPLADELYELQSEVARVFLAEVAA